MQLLVHPPTCLPTYVPPSWALFPATNICEGSALVLSTKYHFLLKALQKKNNKGKCVYACMQNRAIVGGNCVCLHTKQSHYRVGVVFSFYVAKENAFPSQSKCFARVIFHWTLTWIIPVVQCLLFAKARVEERKHRSLSHLRSRKGQHSQFTPDSLKTEIFHRPTCQEWPSCSTKSLCKFLIPFW